MIRLLIVLLLLSTQVAAGDYRLTAILVSNHTESEDMNENNFGLGVEYQFSEGNYVGYARFKNSDNNNSNMISIVTEDQFFIENLYAGFAFGVADNYKDGFGGYQPLAGIVVRYGYLRIMVSPGIQVLGLVICGCT